MTIVPGNLGINRKPVTVKADSQTRIFGEADPELTATVDGAVDGETIDYTVTRSEGNDAGEYAISVTAGNNPNYDVTVENSTLTIEPRQGVRVTIAEHSGNHAYDAAVHTVSGYDVNAISDTLYTVNDFTFGGTASVTGTNAGTYAMNLRPEDFTNTNANFADVAFEIVDGTLKIDPKPAVITANSNVKTYGDADPAMTYRTEGLAGRDFIAASLSREEGEDAGTYAISVSPVANPNYVIETVPGTLTINRRAVTVTANDGIKVYGAEEPELTATITGLASGDSSDVIAYTLIREDGEGAGEYAITPSGEETQGNYNVTFESANLTIVPEDTVVVTITANKGIFKYDGQEKDLSGYAVAISNPLYTEADFAFTGNSDLKGVNAGIYRTAMTAADFTNTNPNFENVVFQVVNGQLEITKRSVTLTSADAAKPYDGMALTSNKVEIGGDGFADGEGVDLTMTGRIVLEGTAENSFVYAMANGTAAENYDIKALFGSLTVTQGLLHKLTIRYVDEQGKQVQKAFSREYAFGGNYSVASAKISGYQADIEAVNGTMGEEDVEVTVTYRPITYTLTVKFTSVTDGRQAAEPMSLRLKSGDSYAIFVPKTEGYTAMTNEIIGKMPSSDREITVFMMPDDATATQRNNHQVAIEIEDYGTPLGVADSILGGGEIIE